MGIDTSNHLYMKKVSLFLISLIFTCNLFSQKIEIVTNNAASANIVVADRANKQLNELAQTISYYIFKSTTARLNVVDYIYSGGCNIIIASKYGGANYNYELLDEDGFIIKTVGHNIIISGKTDFGTAFGVYEFLERFVGVRWLMPTELWTEIPMKKNIVLDNIDIVENPEFLSRSFFNVNMENKDVLLKEWGEKNRLRNRVEFHHNLRNIFKTEVIVKDYPHFIPMVDGKKYIPESERDIRMHPNFQAKGVDVFAANEIVTYFRQNTGKSSYSLGINDGGVFDERNSDGKKNYIGFDSYSTSYYSWVNKTVSIVNRSFPDKKYGLLSYARVAEPPSFKLEDNVVPFITQDRHMWLLPASRQEGIEISKRWQQVTKEYGWYDYVYGSVYLVPRIYFKHYHDYIKIARDLNVRYYVAEYYPNWIEGPKGWVMTKLLWNADQDLDALLNDWYVNAVGVKSAKYLKEFYELWETVWTEEMPKSKWWKKRGTFLSFNNQNYVNDIPYDTIVRADELLTLAYRNASTRIQRARMESLLDMWEFNKMNYLYFRQKNSSSLKMLNKEERLINSKKVTKEEIDKKISELEKHPLYNDIARRYRTSGSVKY